jgi:hypothetical protein
MSLAIPIIHSNGTHPDRLIESLQDASNALSEAEKALKETAPNGRDYYSQIGGLVQAESEYRQRVFAIRKIQEELQTIIEAILLQVEERRRT